MNKAFNFAVNWVENFFILAFIVGGLLGVALTTLLLLLLVGTGAEALWRLI